MSIQKWKIYCTTDSSWECIWDTSAPSTCPTNGVHSVNSNSITSEAVIKAKYFKTITDTSYTIKNLYLYRFDSTSNNITVNIQTAAGDNEDKEYIIKR